MNSISICTSPSHRTPLWLKLKRQHNTNEKAYTWSKGDQFYLQFLNKYTQNCTFTMKWNVVD